MGSQYRTGSRTVWTCERELVLDRGKVHSPPLCTDSWLAHSHLHLDYQYLHLHLHLPYQSVRQSDI